jgi:hypothetical protein
MSFVTMLMGTPTKGTRIARALTKGGIEAAILLDATVRETFSAPSEVTKHPVEGPGPEVSDHVILHPQGLIIEGVITETPFSIRGQVAGVATTIASQVGMRLGNALAGVPGIGGAGNARAIGGAALSAVAAKTLAGVLAPPSVTGRSIDTSEQNLENSFRKEFKLPTDNVRLRDAVNEFLNIREARAPVSIITGLRKYENFVMTDFEVIREVTIGKTLRVRLAFAEVKFAVIGDEIKFLPAIKQALPKKAIGKKNADPVTGEKEAGGSILYDIGSSLGIIKD